MASVKKPTNTSSISALRNLIEEKGKTAETRNKDRVMVITSLAEIERRLEDLLRSNLTPPSEEGNQDELFGDSQPLSNFGAKIRLARRMALISHDLYLLMNGLSKVRNRCAHEPDDFDVFEEMSVKDRVNEYWQRINKKLVDGTISEPAERFQSVCDMVAITLIVARKRESDLNFAPSEVMFNKNN